MKLRRLATAAAVLVAAAGVSACDKEDSPHKAETEGIYVSVGPLKYQVQISRQLNPVNVEDKDYLVGLSRFDRTLGSDNVWFAVFIRVENDGEKGALSAKEFELTDTQGNTFTPIELERSNTYAYRPAIVPGHGEYNVNGTNPAPDSGAIEGPTQGALLLFKLPRATLSNRPLELKINQPGGLEEGEINLDV